MLAAARRHAATTSAPHLLRRLSAHTKPLAPPPPPANEGAGAWARRGVALSLMGLTGALASSAVTELAVFLSCSSQAMEKATESQQIAGAIGEPIKRGPWYSATIAVSKARRSVSCTFPVSGPQGDGILKFKAVRSGDESWFSFLKQSDWEILILDAILDVPTKDGKRQAIRVTVPGTTAAPPPADCRACKSQPMPMPTPTPKPPPSQEK